MKQYICSICGYICEEAVGGPWEALPDNWKCPLCGADKSAFREKAETARPQAAPDKPHVERELSAMEMSIICSNLARGCEKQYLTRQMEDFRKLADFFRSKEEPAKEASTQKLLELIEQDLSAGYPYGNAVDAAGEKHLPVVTVEEGAIHVNVGAVSHPMAPEHFIEWIYVQTEQGGQRRILKPGGDPSVTFALREDEAVAVCAYCNLHGLWMTEV